MLLPFHYGVRGNSKMRFLSGNHCLVRSASEVPGSLGSGILEVIGAVGQHTAIPQQRQVRTGLSYTRTHEAAAARSPSWLSQEFSSLPSQAFATACPALTALLEPNHATCFRSKASSGRLGSSPAWTQLLGRGKLSGRETWRGSET